MRMNRWFSGRLDSLRQSTMHRIEQDLNLGALSLPQPGVWTRRLTQVIIVGLTAGIGWSMVARVDVVVGAKGKLEPLSQSQAIQSRVGGVVTAVLVQEGDQVKQGDLLMQLDKTPVLNQLQSLLIQQNQLVREIAVLRMARQGVPLETIRSQETEIPPELLNRVQTRRLLIAQLSGNPNGLGSEQNQRFALFQQQLQDQIAVNELQGTSLATQIAEIETQLSETEFQFKVEQELVSQLEPLLDEGAISRTDFLRRAIDVNALQSQLNQNRLQKRQLEIDRLQSQVEGRQLLTQTYQNLQQQLADLDAEFDATIKTNQKQLVEVNSQLEQIRLDLKNQDLRAPVDGVAFNLGPRLPGAVAQPGQALLQVVPNESLIARVQVENADIANIRAGMPVEVRIDAYPFTEYGSVEGVVSKIGREAITVDEQNIRTVFPIEVRLEEQFLERQSQQLSLVPGMTLVANIKVRDRAPISYIADELIEAFDSMRSVR